MPLPKLLCPHVSDLETFVKTLWPLRAFEDAYKSSGCLTFWFFPSKYSGHIPLKAAGDHWDSLQSELDSKNEAGEHVYLALGLREPGLASNQQGGKKHVVALPGLCLDIDFRDPKAHVAKNLPEGEADALKILAPFPPPTLVVSTGHGWHCYWLFCEPVWLTSESERTRAQKQYKAFQAQFIERAKALGWHVDQTASIQRVWRVPGFVNHKTGASSSIVHVDDSNRYTFDQISPEKKEPVRRSPTLLGPSAPRAVTSSSLQSLRDALSKLRSDNPNKEAIDKLLLGESFADAERDYWMQRLCSTVAWMPEAHGLTIDEIAEIFRSSLSVWASEIDEDRPAHLQGREVKTLDQELEKVRDKLLRARQDYNDQQEERWRELQPIRDVLRVDPNDSEAPKEGEDKEKEIDFLQRHSIIQFKSAFWVWNFTEKEYIGPKTDKELYTYLKRAWEDAPPGFDLDYLNAKGQLIDKKVPELLKDYGYNADKVIGNLGLQKTYLDRKKNILYESVTPLRNLEPRYDERIAEWLKLLAGSSHKKLLDWLAGVTRLNEQCCLLYLNGVSGAGKGLLASGVAKLWSEVGATELELATDKFNASIFDCPFLFLDEGGAIDSVQIRALVGRSSFTYNQKMIPTRQVKGSIRLLVAANNDQVLLNDRDNMTIEDMEASIKRILHIRARQEAADWLIENNARNELTDQWVDNDLIARHCLWLRDNVEIDRGKRFLVEGENMENMHRAQLMGGDVAGLVYEWAVRFGSDPERLYSAYETMGQNPFALIGSEYFLIRIQAVIDCWDIYMGNDIRRPKTAMLRKTLERISIGERRPRLKNGERPRFKQIRFDLVMGWAIDNQVGDETKMSENFLSRLRYLSEEDE